MSDKNWERELPMAVLARHAFIVACNPWRHSLVEFRISRFWRAIVVQVQRLITKEFRLAPILGELMEKVHINFI